jgi:CheY-like chemotaxis protein
MLKVLVAEDDPVLAEVFVTLLRHWNCETAFEYTGTAAPRRAATFKPDVALLGVVMPEMGGVEAAIKLLEICNATKIVLVAEPVSPESLALLEAQGYRFETLPAPFTSDQLHAVVFGHTRGQRG